MLSFNYLGYRADGSQVRGTFDATSADAVQEQLNRQGIFPSSITQRQVKKSWFRHFLHYHVISVRDTALFTRRLATLLEAAVPLHEALAALVREEKNQHFHKILKEITAAVAEGASLSVALNKSPEVFKDSYRAMVAAGEAGGALAEVLKKLADFLEHQEKLQRSVTTASIYPLFMAVTGSAVVLFLLAFVIPQITGIFAHNNAALPFITVILLFVSGTLRKLWWVLILLIIVTITIYRRLSTKKRFLAHRDAYILNLPIVGNLIKTLALAQMTRTLSLLLASGVPLLQALDISKQTVSNRIYQTTMADARIAVAEGTALSAALANSPLFPGILTHLLAVGEKSGSLDHTLHIAASRFEEEFEEATKRYLSLLEPLMILTMGLLVGTVVIAVLLPIFQLNQLIM